MARILIIIHLFFKPQDFFINILWRLKDLSCDFKSLRVVKLQHTWELAAIQKMQYVCYKAGIQNFCSL